MKKGIFLPGGRSTTNVRSISGGQYTVSREDTCFCLKADQILRQLSLSISWWGTMIFVAGRLGFSIWLIICVAASIPSCPELISMEVSCGEVSLAKSELLKERMDRSSGMEISASIQIRSRESARISSLTSTAVGRSSLKSSFRSSETHFWEAAGTSIQYSGCTVNPWLISAVM